jgi:hypothetical protein
MYSNDPVVEANCSMISINDGVVVANNYGNDCGRNLVKLEWCQDAIVDSNMYSENRVVNFNGMQAQGECNNVVFSNNVLREVGHGFQISSTAGAMTNIVVDGNVIDDIAGNTSIPGTPDGIVIQNVNCATVTNNTIRNSPRSVIQLAAVFGNVVVSSNVITKTDGLAAASVAIGVGPLPGTAVDSVVITENLCNGHQDTTNGIIAVQQDSGAAATIASMVISNNTMIGINATNNRGLRGTTGVVMTNGLISGNVSNANDEFYGGSGSTLCFRNNVSNDFIGSDTTMGRALPSATSPPSTGGRIGDVVFHSAPAPSGNIGWVCTTAGIPGTWKAFGTISA